MLAATSTTAVPPSRAAETLHQRAAKGGLVSGVSFVLGLGLNLVQVPLLLRFWPHEIYGLWLSVGALSAVLTSLDGGHQAYVGNLLSYFHVADRGQLRRVLASAVRVAALTSTLQIAFTLALCFSGEAARWLKIDAAHSADFALAIVIYTVGWISTGSVNAVLVRLYLPAGHFVRSTWWAIAMRIGQFGAVAFSAWMGWGLVGTSALFALVVFLLNLAVFADIRRLFPDLFPWWRGGDFRLGLGNFGKSTVLSVVALLDLFSLQGVVLLVTGALGALAVPLFTTLRTVANTAMQGTSFLLSPIQADLVRYQVQREVDKIGAVFGFFWLATGAVINGGMLAGLFVLEPVYRAWTRGQLEFDRALFAWLAAGVLVRTLASPMQTYLTANNELKALAAASITRAAVTVGGTLLLVHTWGLPGVGAALFASELAGSLLLPWWFAGRALAALHGRIDGATAGLALVSTGLACGALAGFAANLVHWGALAGLALLGVFGVAGLQWRLLPAVVKARAFALVQSLPGLRRTA